MITRLRHGLSMSISIAAVSVFCMLISVFPSFAANVAGKLENADSTTISGWAVDTDSPDKNAEVVLYLYVDGTMEAKELAKVKADQYRSDLAKDLGNGNHSFSYKVNWDELEGTSFIVEAYVVSGDERIRLNGSPQFTKKAAKDAAGPASKSGDVAAAATAADHSVTGKKGGSLGNFVTTAYCSCSTCSSGSNLTYSGTVPKPDHTISADIGLYPIGTKLMIGNTVYTVEDIGSSVNGNCLDIFFDSHQQALNYGRKTVEVFSVE